MLNTRRLLGGVLAVLCVVLGTTSGCSGGSSPSPTAPTSLATTPLATTPTVWKQATSATSNAVAATNAFREYSAVTRTPTVRIIINAQPGVGASLQNWYSVGPALVSRMFSYSPYAKPIDVFLALDGTWVREAILKNGWSKEAAANFQTQLNTGNAGSAWAASEGFLVVSASTQGNSQTPGHEFFHLVQMKWVGADVGTADGSKIPNWFWEGSCVFIGRQTAGELGFEDYGQARAKDAFTASSVTARLIDVKSNDRNGARPYEIGFIGVEYLVANIGMQKFVNIFDDYAHTRNFESAFARATGASLDDFSSAFEASRQTLLGR